ncbi:MAG TPA: 50S ribosomal protein L9 [Myxococcales bacterium]|nr:50S ribosomal protein L9 [Myxococcales bacterium]
MKVILTKDLDNLGRAGALVDVKTGYGRNYLLPRNLAVLATAKNIRQLEHQKSGILARAAKEKQNMAAIAQKISAIEVKFTRKVGDQNKLFGSVTSKDVHEQLVAQGYPIERKQVHMPEPLKEVGTHEVQVKLHPEVTVMLKVTVGAEA